MAVPGTRASCSRNRRRTADLKLCVLHATIVLDATAGMEVLELFQNHVCRAAGAIPELAYA
jgi:ribosomal protein L32